MAGRRADEADGFIWRRRATADGAAAGRFCASRRKMRTASDTISACEPTELAALLKVSTVCVQMWRNGRWLPKLPQAFALSRLFGTAAPRCRAVRREI